MGGVLDAGNQIQIPSTQTCNTTQHKRISGIIHTQEMFKLNDRSESNQDSLPIVSSPPSSSASGLLNLSKYKLNAGCKRLLAKGLEYIPAPRVTKRIEVEEAYSNFARRLKLSFFFHNKKSRTIDQKFRPKSNFIPPGPNNPVLRLELDHLKRAWGL